MHTLSSASRTFIALASAVEWTATVLIPISRHARCTRSAISPRLAISTFSNIRLTPSPPFRISLQKERFGGERGRLGDGEDESGHCGGSIRDCAAAELAWVMTAGSLDCADHGAAQVVDGGEGEDVSGVARQCCTSGAGQAVETLHGAEDGFHRRPAAGHQIVPAAPPARQLGMPLVGAPHQAVLDPQALEALMARLLRIGLVAIDGALVADDQRVGHLALIDLGRGDHNPADQTRALINPEMGFVAKQRAAVAAGPVGARLLVVGGPQTGG